MMSGYSGLVGLGIQCYEGLDTLIRAAFQGPVHIMRQFKPHSETNQYAQYASYHRFEGLSIAPEKTRESRRITSIPGRITNQVSGICGYVGNNGLGYIGLG